MSYQALLTEQSGSVLIITINRPDKMNALNKTVIEELGEVLDKVYQDPGIKAALITGAGKKAFVAGADISEFADLSAAGGAALASKGQDLVFSKIENCPKPVIAAVNGFALGGGCELAMACHFRIASKAAKFGQPEVNLGLIPGYGGTQRLTHLIGKGRAMELMMTGDMIDAEKAYQWGLINHIFDEDELVTEGTKILEKISSKAPLAISKIVRLVNIAAVGHENALQQEIDAFGDCFSTEDMKEGTLAFLEKRKAIFKGK